MDRVSRLQQNEFVTRTDDCLSTAIMNKYLSNLVATCSFFPSLQFVRFSSLVT